MAGIQLLLNLPQEAISFYREVLQLSARFSGENAEAKLTIDKLLIIHTLHNLAEVLETNTPIQPTLHDGTLQHDCFRLEQEYLEKFIGEVSDCVLIPNNCYERDPMIEIFAFCQLPRQDAYNSLYQKL